MELGKQEISHVPTNQVPSSLIQKELSHHVGEPTVYDHPLQHVEHNEENDPFVEKIKKKDVVHINNGCIDL